jgi:hypothetical protein
VIGAVPSGGLLGRVVVADTAVEGTVTVVVVVVAREAAMLADVLVVTAAVVVVVVVAAATVVVVVAVVVVAAVIATKMWVVHIAPFASTKTPIPATSNAGLSRLAR